MKKTTALPIALGLTAIGVVGLIAGVSYFVRPKDNLEVQVKQSEPSPDGKWTAFVQMEVFNTALVVNDAVYAVRLRGPEQKDSAGDLVMNVPVNYPIPEPSVDWRNGNLVITLAKNQNYQYLKDSVDGVAVIVQRNADSGGQKSFTP